ICSNQVPYVWNGNSYSITTLDSVKLTSVSGCDSMSVLDLAVNSTLRSVTTVAICSNQVPYIWNGNSYSITTLDSVKLTSVSGCDSMSVLDLAVNSTLRSLTSVVICSNQVPYIWNGNSYSITTLDSVKLTSVSGCDSMSVLDL